MASLSPSTGSLSTQCVAIMSLVTDIPPGEVNVTGIFMNRRSFSQLRKSRTAYNPTGAPAPYANEFEGVPIFVTDAIA